MFEVKRRKGSVRHRAKDHDQVSQLHTLITYLEQLGRGELRVTEQDDWPTDHVLRLIVGSLTIGIHIEGEVDLKKALDRIRKQTQAKQKEATRLQGRLASVDFTAKASPEVIQESKERLEALTAELSLLSSSEQQLQKMVS